MYLIYLQLLYFSFFHLVEIPNPVTSQKNSNGVKKENKEKFVGTKPQSGTF